MDSNEIDLDTLKTILRGAAIKSTYTDESGVTRGTVYDLADKALAMTAYGLRNLPALAKGTDEQIAMVDDLLTKVANGNATRFEIEKVETLCRHINASL